MNQSKPKTVAPYEKKIVNLKDILKKTSCPKNSNYIFEYNVINLVIMKELQNKLNQTQYKHCSMENVITIYCKWKVYPNLLG